MDGPMISTKNAYFLLFRRKNTLLLFAIKNFLFSQRTFHRLNIPGWREWYYAKKHSENAHMDCLQSIEIFWNANWNLPLYENILRFEHLCGKYIYFFEQIKISASKAILSSSTRNMCQTTLILKSRWCTDRPVLK